MKPFAAACLCCLLAFAAGSAGAAEPLPEVLDRVAAAYGPRPGALRETGRAFSALEGEGALLRLWRHPDRFHLEIAYAQANENRTLIGDRAWNRRAPANPMAKGAIVLQAARIGLPWTLLERATGAVDLGESSLPDGRRVRGVEFAVDESRRVAIEVDPQTGWILRSRGQQSIGGTVIEFVTVYSDFRRDGARVHAAREEQYAAGAHTGYSVIEKVEYLDTLPDGAFAPWLSADAGTAASP